MRNIALMVFILFGIHGVSCQVFTGDSAGLYSNAPDPAETVNIFTFPPPFGALENMANDSLDFNRDGRFDAGFNCFTINTFDGVGGIASIISLHPGLSLLVDSDHFVRRLDVGTIVDENQLWASLTDGFLSYKIGGLGGYIEQGNWLVNPNGYLGLRLVEGQDTLYGWIKILASVASNGSATIKVQQWAIQLVDLDKPPAEVIVAGTHEGLVYGGAAVVLHQLAIPVETSYTSADSIDLNGDGIQDVAFNLFICNLSSCTGSTSAVVALHPGFAFAERNHQPRNYATGDSIFARASWYTEFPPQQYGLLSTAGTFSNTTYNDGEWLQDHEGYIGFRLVTPAADTLLGWILVYTYTNGNTEAHLEVKDWAIEFDPKSTPFARISVFPQKAVYCPGDSVLLHADIIGANQFGWHLWNGNTASYNNVPQILPDSSVQVVFEASNQNGSITQTLVLEVSTLALTTQDVTLTCANPLGALSANTNVPATLWWIVNGDTTISPQFPVIQVPGAIEVIAIDSNGCIAYGQIDVHADTDPPAVSILPVAGTDSLVAVSNAPDVVFSWIGPGQITAAGAFIAALTPGEYTVTATGANGCTATATYTMAVSQNLEPDMITFSVSPNPFSDVLTVHNISSQPLFFQVLDVAGKTVLPMSIIDRNGKAQLNTQSLPTGFYWLSGARADGKPLVFRKLVKI